MFVVEIMICFEALLCFKLTLVIFLSRFGEEPETLSTPMSSSMLHFLMGQDVDFVLKEVGCIAAKEMSLRMHFEESFEVHFEESFEVGSRNRDALIKLEEILSEEAVLLTWPSTILVIANSFATAGRA